MIRHFSFHSRIQITNKTTGLLSACIFLLPLLAHGQTSGTKQSEGGLDVFMQEKTPVSVTQPVGIALESTIDPNNYFVGPSDVFSVNIWMSPPLSATLTVTPEGTLIIPTVGELKVSDLTLAKAKELIITEVRKKYSIARSTATLIRPRQIIVTVIGNVLTPGLYTLTSIERATGAIEEANKITRAQQAEEQKQVIDQMSLRNIVVRHKDGGRERVDITKFLAIKEDRWNPYLREGDVIIVPRKNPTKNVFGVYGEINAPGRYEFVEGDSLLDAVRIGQGFTRLALLDSVEFSRLSNDGNRLETRRLNLQRILTHGEPNFPIEPGDRIVVRARIDQREDYRVTVEGEVVYPGTYPITKSRTKLSDVVRLAGGFTEYADLKAAEITRRSILPREALVEEAMTVRGNANAEDTAYLNLETKLRIRREFVSVDLEKLFKQNDSTQDLILLTEDTIRVPTVKTTVYVFGQVRSPGHVSYMKGKDFLYYINRAGGYTNQARSGDMKIIKARTKQWLSPNETTIEEGDYIWVPLDPERQFLYYSTISSQIASVLSVIVGIAVIMIQVSK